MARGVVQSGGCQCRRAIDTFNFNIFPLIKIFRPAFDFAQLVAPRVFGMPVALATDKSAQVEAQSCWLICTVTALSWKRTDT
jgi:hypothetical protein